MRVDRLLENLLTATAAKTAASRRVDRYRDQLDTEARRRYADEGAAPSWKAPELGTVRLDPKPAKAYVEDRDAFTSYVAQRFPSECTATITVTDPQKLAAALQALEFAGIAVTADVAVRPQFAETLLANTKATYDEDPELRSAVRILNADTGEAELVDGAGVLPPTATLVVTLDKTARARTIAAVDEALDAELEEPPAAVQLLADPSTPEGQPTAEDRAEAARIGDRLAALAGVQGYQLGEPGPLEAAAMGERMALDVTLGEVLELARDNATGAGLDEVAPGVIRAEAEAAAAHATFVQGGYSTPELEAERLSADRHGRAPAPALSPEEAATVERFERSRRSAQIDREEVDCLDREDPRRPELLASADRWDEQAERLEHSAQAAPAHRSEPGLVDELVKLNSDDLKRAARARRVAVSGTKVILAHRLIKAGVASADDVLAHRP